MCAEDTCCCGGNDSVPKASDHCGCEAEGSDVDGGGVRREVIKLSVGAALLAVGMVAGHFFTASLPGYAHLWLFIAAYIVLGGGVVLRALSNVVRGEVFDENFLMSAATIGAFAIGEYSEAVGVMLFYGVGELFQSMAVGRSKASIARLMDIRPDYANIKRGGDIVKVAAESVVVGDVIVVKPGEKIPLDGTVTEGASTLDASALTGESLPKGVGVNDAVLSGCINLNGLLTISVTKAYGESTASKIIALVESAAGKKAKTENFITAFARYYTPAVVAAALLIAVLPPLFFGGAWMDWINRGLIFLVVSCPCALVLSIPMSFFAGVGKAARRGILVKGGACLETLSRLDTVVFDKTGTLTKGVFKVAAIRPESGFSREDVLSAAAGAESLSNHPIALSIAREYEKSAAGGGLINAINDNHQGDVDNGEHLYINSSSDDNCHCDKHNDVRGKAINSNGFDDVDKDMHLYIGNDNYSNNAGNDGRIDDVRNSVRPGGINKNDVAGYNELPGFGVSASVGGKAVLAGNAKLMAKHGIAVRPELRSVGTVVYVAIEGVFAGSVEISDEVKGDSRSAVSALRLRGVVRTVMLTGDDPRIAEAVAAEIGIDEVYGGLLPHEKAEKAEFLINQKRAVGSGRLAFVGDGINDAPAIAIADVGIAMGALGSDAAIEAADAVLMTDEPSKLVEAVDIARFTKKIVWQNITFVLILKAVFLGLGALGMATMWEAVFADVGAALIAVANAARIARR